MTSRTTPVAGAAGDGPVMRTVRLLRELAQATEPLTVSGLATALDLPASTVHRLLQILKQEGMVRTEPGSHRYQPGLEFHRIATLVAAHDPVPAAVRDIMTRTVAACDETAALGLLLPDRRSMVGVLTVETSNPLRFTLPMNVPGSLAWGASGLAILAFMPDDEVEELIRCAEPSPVTGQHVDPVTLRRKLATVREAGFHVSQGEKIPDSVGVAAPVFAGDGAVIGSYGVTIPRVRYDPGQREQLGALVREHAGLVSAAFGAPESLSHPSRLNEQSAG